MFFFLQLHVCVLTVPLLIPALPKTLFLFPSVFIHVYFHHSLVICHSLFLFFVPADIFRAFFFMTSFFHLLLLPFSFFHISWFTFHREIKRRPIKASLNAISFRSSVSHVSLICSFSFNHCPIICWWSIHLQIICCFLVDCRSIIPTLLIWNVINIIKDPL